MSTDPKDPQYFPRLRRNMRVVFLVIGLILLALIIVQMAWGAPLKARLDKLARDDVAYEIVNDGDDHGNFIETYHIPNGRGGKVYCIVWSDRMEGGRGGGGIDCDWGNSR